VHDVIHHPVEALKTLASLEMKPGAGVMLCGIALAISSACDLPTDRSAELAVELDDLPPLIVNDTLTLSARVLIEGDSLPNAEIRFSADNESVLNVSPDGRLLAVGPGDVTVSATAVTYLQAPPATHSIRVRDTYELDSIAPAAVRYGATFQLFGVGLTQTLGATLGGADAILESYTPVDPEQRNRFGVLSLYAAPPAPSQSQAVLLGFEGILISDTITVIRRDIYEPNDTVPRVLDQAQLPLSNPALAFERVRRGEGQLAVDWYRFTTDGAEDWTISAWSPAGGARFKVYVTNSLVWSSQLLDSEGLGIYAVAPGAWGVGTSFRPCDGMGLYFPGFGEYAYTFEVPPDSAVIPLADLPAGTYNVLVSYGEGFPFYDKPNNLAGVGVFVDSLNLAQPLRTGLEIRPGYNSLLPRDDLEENDYCDVARDIAVPGTITSLTVDSPHDADWYKFTLGSPQRVRFRVETTGDFADFADLDTYVVHDLRPDSLVVVDFGAGADVDATEGALLDAGDYFLIVVDFLGVPTQYTLSSEILGATPAAQDIPSMKSLLERKRREAAVRRIIGAETRGNR
jgi:hypothetical protein